MVAVVDSVVVVVVSGAVVAVEALGTAVVDDFGASDVAFVVEVVVDGSVEVVGPVGDGGGLGELLGDDGFRLIPPESLLLPTTWARGEPTNSSMTVMVPMASRKTVARPASTCHRPTLRHPVIVWPAITVCSR